MDFCSAGDLSIYIRKRGDLPSLTASNQGLPAEQGIVASGTEKVLYPHPKEGGLNETIVRCFLGQLGESTLFFRACGEATSR
jgi:serine/threonine-protein kinase ULK/ATG1